MQLLVIRHAIAEDREEFAASGRADSERPLTDYGRRRMRKNARGLRRIAPNPDVVASSPFLRAADTARIVADAFGVANVETLEELTPEHRPRDLAQWLARHPPDAVVAVVGHEPHLGTLITWLIGGREAHNAELKKGGACLLEVGNSADGGAATMHWLLTPAQLRSIAD
jgi:phosphohistidine phosphatase